MALQTARQWTIKPTCLPEELAGSVHLEQEQISVTKQPLQGDSAKFTCKMLGGSDSTYIHWYRAPATGALQRLLYLSSSESNPRWEAGFSTEKLTAYFQSRNICRLLVHKLEETDSGRYYCGAWDFTQYHKLPATLHKSHHSSVYGA
uniref:Ig-like domain-containing protein n=1 Tax=Chelydra serpentina TaxID=8475 RepID=A0A8C3SDR3_CHESE